MLQFKQDLNTKYAGVSFPGTSCYHGRTYPNPVSWTIIRIGTYIGVRSFGRSTLTDQASNTIE